MLRWEGTGHCSAPPQKTTFQLMIRLASTSERRKNRIRAIGNSIPSLFHISVKNKKLEIKSAKPTNCTAPFQAKTPTYRSQRCETHLSRPQTDMAVYPPADQSPSGSPPSPTDGCQAYSQVDANGTQEPPSTAEKEEGKERRWRRWRCWPFAKNRAGKGEGEGEGEGEEKTKVRPVPR